VSIEDELWMMQHRFRAIDELHEASLDHDRTPDERFVVVATDTRLTHYSAEFDRKGIRISGICIRKVSSPKYETVDNSTERTRSAHSGDSRGKCQRHYK
jgi:hypothetical protein